MIPQASGSADSADDACRMLAALPAQAPNSIQDLDRGWQLLSNIVRALDEDMVKDCREEIDTNLVFVSTVNIRGTDVYG